MSDVSDEQFCASIARQFGCYGNYYVSRLPDIPLYNVEFDVNNTNETENEDNESDDETQSENDESENETENEDESDDEEEDETNDESDNGVEIEAKNESSDESFNSQEDYDPWTVSNLTEEQYLRWRARNYDLFRDDDRRRYRRYACSNNNNDINNNNELFECSHCEKTFTRRSSLTMHEHSHSNVRLFNCTRCPNKSFKFMGHLRRHEETMHPEFKCDVCGKVNNSQHSLNEHRILHNRQPQTTSTLDNN